jgi:hypothetical protein
MPGTYDLLSAGHFASPWATFARMRADDSLYWCEPMGLHVATRYADVRAITRDGRFSSARVDGFMPAGADDRTAAVRRFFSDWMAFQDPPAHSRLRRLASHAFVPRVIAGLEDYVRQAVADALARVDGKDQLDIVRDVGFPVPSQVIAHMLGVAPDRVDDFGRWSHDIFAVPSLLGDPDEKVATAYAALDSLSAYFRELIAERRARPADDLLTLLVQAEEDGSVLSEHELIANCALLLIAGHETTTNLIGNATLALLRNPAELDRLQAEPALGASAVEEFLRYRLDLGRGDTRHLAFGGGPHSCLGAALARMETRIALSALLARYPRLELAADPPPIVGWTVRGVTSLPVSVG